MNRRVVITGLGVVSPIGIGKEEFKVSLFAGKSGVAEVTLFDASSFPTKIAAEVKGFEPEKFLKNMNVLNITNDRRAQFANAASKLAIDDSKIDENMLNSTRCGVAFGSGVHTAITKDDPIMFSDFQKNVSDDKSFNFKTFSESLSKNCELSVIPANLGTITVANQYSIKGLCYTAVSACAAASQAIGMGFRAIKRNELDVSLTGGYDSMIFPFGMACFCLLEAMTTKNDELTEAIKPFDKRRDGFVLGEGSGVIILEELEHAKKRNANIYGEMIGYGTSIDAYRVTDPHPEGRGAAQAMRNALKDAGISPDEVDYINAHGTSTPKNDKIETKAIKDVFGHNAHNIPVSSTKSMVGHLISAAGAIEFVASVLALQNDCVPPTINYKIPDTECDLDYVPIVARKAKVDTVLSNSFGFGGQNSSLIARKFVN